MVPPNAAAQAKKKDKKKSMATSSDMSSSVPISSTKRKGQQVDKRQKESSSKTKKTARRQQSAEEQQSDQMDQPKPKSRSGLRTRTAEQQKKQKQYVKLLEGSQIEDDDYTNYYQEDDFVQTSGSRRKSTPKSKKNRARGADSDSEEVSSDIEELFAKNMIFEKSENFCYTNAAMDLLSDTTLMVNACTDYISSEMKNHLSKHSSRNDVSTGDKSSTVENDLPTQNESVDAAELSSAMDDTESDEANHMGNDQTMEPEVKTEHSEESKSPADSNTQDQSLDSIIDLSVYNYVRLNGHDKERQLQYLQRKRSHRALNGGSSHQRNSKRRKISKKNKSPLDAESKSERERMKLKCNVDMYEVVSAQLPRIPDAELEKEKLSEESQQAIESAIQRNKEAFESQMQQTKTHLQESSAHFNEEDEAALNQKIIESMPDIPSTYYFLTQHTASQDDAANIEQLQQLNQQGQHSTRSQKYNVVDLFQQVQGFHTKGKLFRLNPLHLINDVYALPKKSIASDLRAINGKPGASGRSSSSSSAADKSLADYDQGYVGRTRSGNKRLSSESSTATPPRKASRRTTKNSNRSVPKTSPLSPSKKRQTQPQSEESTAQEDISVEQSSSSSPVSEDTNNNPPEVQSIEDTQMVDTSESNESEETNNDELPEMQPQQEEEEQQSNEEKREAENDDTEKAEPESDQTTTKTEPIQEEESKESDVYSIRRRRRKPVTPAKPRISISTNQSTSDSEVDPLIDGTSTPPSDDLQKSSPVEETTKTLPGEEEEVDQAENNQTTNGNHESENDQQSTTSMSDEEGSEKSPEGKDKSKADSFPTRRLRRPKNSSPIPGIFTRIDFSGLSLPKEGRYNTRSSERKMLETVASFDSEPSRATLSKRRIRRVFIHEQSSDGDNDQEHKEEDQQHKEEDQQHKEETSGSDALELPRRKIRKRYRQDDDE